MCLERSGRKEERRHSQRSNGGGAVRCTIQKKLALTVGKMGVLSGLLCSGTPLATQAGEGQGRSGAGREASAVNGQVGLSYENWHLYGKTLG